MRLVSLTCSNTEIVHSLGYAAQLVGVDDHSDYPADVVAKLPRVGPDLSVDPEKVAALEPDLVLASLTVPGHEKVAASLEARGYRCWSRSRSASKTSTLTCGWSPNGSWNFLRELVRWSEPSA